MDFVSWGLDYLAKNPWYERHLLHSLTPDECFWQTLFMLSPYKDTQHEYLHYIDWTGCKNSPRVLTMDNYDKIKDSPHLMARKFDINVDKEILEKLVTDNKQNG